MNTWGIFQLFKDHLASHRLVESSDDHNILQMASNLSSLIRIRRVFLSLP